MCTRVRGRTQSVPRGALMSHLDSIWVKSALVRPCTAPARVNQAAAAARRKAEVYDYWLKKHRGEIESHARVVEREYAEEKRIRRERVADRRHTQLEAYRVKAEASRARALERQEPYPIRREMDDHRTSLLSRQRERAWSQDIVFLPHKVAAREKHIIRCGGPPHPGDGAHFSRSLLPRSPPHPRSHTLAAPPSLSHSCCPALAVPPSLFAAPPSLFRRERKAADYQAERDAVLRLPPPC